MRFVPATALVLACLGAAVSAASPAKPPEKATDKPTDKKANEPRAWMILADRVYTATGRNLEGGVVLVNNGKIAGVSPGKEDDHPSDTTIHVYAITPGLVDASARITSGLVSVEQSREVTPEMRVADTLDPYANEWDREVRNGVTTVLVNPPDSNVIGGLGVVLKTAGSDSIRERTVKPDAVLRGAMGSDPSRGNHPAFGRPTDFYSRRPTTRMGVEWTWRKAFYDAAAAAKDPSRAFPGSDRLIAALKGDMTVAIQAWTTQDIRTAVRLKEEIQREDEFKNGLDKPRFFIDAAAEAWKDPEMLVRSRTPVVLPPFPVSGRTRDNAFMAWDVAEELRKDGIPFALSSHGQETYDQRLSMQAGYAMAGGLPFEDALAAVTITPARFIGVDKRVGSLEVGKDADLVLWNGEPFQPSARVVAVIIDGVLRYDGRAKEAK